MSDFQRLAAALSSPEQQQPSIPEKKLARRLSRISEVMQQLAARSAELHTPADDSSDSSLASWWWSSSSSSSSSLLPNGGWSMAVDVLYLRPHESTPEGRLAEQRWDCLLRGWLPTFRELCLTIEALRTCRERAQSSGGGGGGGGVAMGETTEHENPPADLLSLNAMCLVQCGMELLVCWGIGPRLDPCHRLGLAALRQPPLTHAPDSGRGTSGAREGQAAGTNGTSGNGAHAHAGSSSSSSSPVPCFGGRPLSKPGAAFLAPKVLAQREASAAAQRRAAEQLLAPPLVTNIAKPLGCGGSGGRWEDPGRRRLRLLCLIVVLERTLRISQLRPLLLPRYHQDLVAALLELALNHIEVVENRQLEQPRGRRGTTRSDDQGRDDIDGKRRGRRGEGGEGGEGDESEEVSEKELAAHLDGARSAAACEWGRWALAAALCGDASAATSMSALPSGSNQRQLQQQRGEEEEEEEEEDGWLVAPPTSLDQTRDASAPSSVVPSGGLGLGRRLGRHHGPPVAAVCIGLLVSTLRGLARLASMHRAAVLSYFPTSAKLRPLSRASPPSSSSCSSSPSPLSALSPPVPSPPLPSPPLPPPQPPLPPLPPLPMSWDGDWLPAPGERSASMMRGAERLAGGLLSRLLCRNIQPPSKSGLKGAWVKSGLEVILESYLGPLTAHKAQRVQRVGRNICGGSGGEHAGEVAALEQLVAQLTRVPEHLSNLQQQRRRQRQQRPNRGMEEEQSSQRGARTEEEGGHGGAREYTECGSDPLAAYVSCLLPQLATLVPRALFVYSPHNTTDDARSNSGMAASAAVATAVLPPAGALDGVTAYVVMRLVGALADAAWSVQQEESGGGVKGMSTFVSRTGGGNNAVIADQVEGTLDDVMPPLGGSGYWHHQPSCPPWFAIRRAIVVPLLTPLLLAAGEEVIGAAEEMGALVALHAFAALVPPTPGLLRMLTSKVGRKTGGETGTEKGGGGGGGGDDDDSESETLGAAFRALETEGVLTRLLEMLIAAQLPFDGNKTMVEEIDWNTTHSSRSSSSNSSSGSIRVELAAASAAGILRRLDVRSAAEELRDAVRRALERLHGATTATTTAVATTTTTTIATSTTVADIMDVAGLARAEAVAEAAVGVAFELLERVGSMEQQARDAQPLLPEANSSPKCKRRNTKKEVGGEEGEEDSISLKIALFELLLGRYFEGEEEGGEEICAAIEGREKARARAAIERQADLRLLATLTERLDPVTLFGDSGGNGSGVSEGALSLLRTLARLMTHVQRQIEGANRRAMIDEAARNHMVGVVSGAPYGVVSSGVSTNYDSANGFDSMIDTLEEDPTRVLSAEDRRLMAQVITGNGSENRDWGASVGGGNAAGPGEDAFTVASLTLSIFGSALLLAPPPPPPLQSQQPQPQPQRQVHGATLGMKAAHRREALLDNMVVPIAGLTAAITATVALAAAADSSDSAFAMDSSSAISSPLLSAVDSSSQIPPVIEKTLFGDGEDEAGKEVRGSGVSPRDWDVLARKSQDVHLFLLRRKRPPATTQDQERVQQPSQPRAAGGAGGVHDEGYDGDGGGSWDARVRLVFQRAALRASGGNGGGGGSSGGDSNCDGAGLLSSEPHVRAQAVASLSAVLQGASKAAEIIVGNNLPSRFSSSCELASGGLLDRTVGNGDGKRMIEVLASASSSSSSSSSFSSSFEASEMEVATAAAAAAAAAAVAEKVDADKKARINGEVVRFSDATLGLVLGVLLGMLCDEESYVYLGAVHALRQLLGMAGGGKGSANRHRHFGALAAAFAQAPLPPSNYDDLEHNSGKRAGTADCCLGGASSSSSSGVTARAAREAMAPLLQLHLERRMRLSSALEEGSQLKLHRDAEAADIQRVLLALKQCHDDNDDDDDDADADCGSGGSSGGIRGNSRRKSSSSGSRRSGDSKGVEAVGAHKRATIPLTFSQRLPLGEALVLALRWAGNAAPHYAPILLPALISGARRPPSAPGTSFSSSSSSSSHQKAAVECLAQTALRASCFSGLAELGTHMGWGVHRYAQDLSDLCRGALLHERGTMGLPPILTAVPGARAAAGIRGGDTGRRDSAAGDGAADRNRAAVRRGAAFLARRLVEAAAGRGEIVLRLPSSSAATGDHHRGGQERRNGSDIVDLIGGIATSKGNWGLGARGTATAAATTTTISSSWLQELCATLRDIDRGPGVARAAAKTATEVQSGGGSSGSCHIGKARGAEWSLEGDAAVRFHVQAALLCVDDSASGVTALSL